MSFGATAKWRTRGLCAAIRYCRAIIFRTVGRDWMLPQALSDLLVGAHSDQVEARARAQAVVDAQAALDTATSAKSSEDSEAASSKLAAHTALDAYLADQTN